ncbi:MAG: hypothetical protein AAGC67_00045 [Myxococcota bacterium]
MTEGDGRKLTYAERDRLRREGERPSSGRRRTEEAKASKAALAAADALFSDEQGGREGEVVAEAVRAAHGSPELSSACRTYVDAVGVPRAFELISIFLDAGDKALSIAVLDELLRQKGEGGFALHGGLRRQIRLLSEDFDDDLASRAEALLD